MKFIIQSFSDIITNSSSEVFVSQKNDALIDALKTRNINYYCYETDEDLRKAVEECPWDFDEITDFNPYREWFMEDLKKHRNSDDIWNFFKSFYTDLLSKIIVDVDRDYLYRQSTKHNINIFKLVKE